MCRTFLDDLVLLTLLEDHSKVQINWQTLTLVMHYIFDSKINDGDGDDYDGYDDDYGGGGDDDYDDIRVRRRSTNHWKKSLLWN